MGFALLRQGKRTPEGAERLVAIGLAAGRLAIGAGLWLAPGPASKALGFGSLDPKALALGRIAASRDLVLGFWQLRSLGSVEELRRASLAVAAADAGDALTFVLAAATGAEAGEAGVRGAAGAIPAAAAGFWLVRSLRE